MARHQIDDLVRLAEYSSDLEAQIDAASLRSAGIQVEVRNAGAYMPLPGAGVSLYVFAAEMVEAKALLAAGRPREDDPATEATWRRSPAYIYTRLALRIGLVLYLVLAVYSVIVR